MKIMLKKIRLCILIIATIVLLNGCLLQSNPVLTGSVQEDGTVLISISIGNSSVSPCTTDALDPLEFDCDYESTVEGDTFLLDISTVRLVGTAALIFLILDPIIVQVPANASNFAGVFGVNGTGGNLVIDAGLTTIQIDNTTTLVAEPGTLFVVIDLPATAPIPGDFTFNFNFVLPQGTTSLQMKPMATGRVEVGGQTFHVPLLPCVTDFASVPAITTSLPVPGATVTLPSYSGLGCDNVTYDFTTVAPPIDIVKEVSVDGGVTFFDANDSANAPATAIGGGALYRLTVTNTGTSDLTNVALNDATLRIVNFNVGDLAAGQTVVLTAGEIPALEQPGRCTTPGGVTNIATVDGQSVDTGNTFSDSDPAVVRCEKEEIQFVKEVSVDGGVTFFDANDSASAPATAIGGGALYRLTVTNTGTSDLTNVEINDAALGIVDRLVGNLAAGQTVVLTSGKIPELEQPGRCQDPGDVTNVATVDGESVDIGDTVMDSDPAVVRCEEDNQPPACADAEADPRRIWPPNHKLLPVEIIGVTDPDGDDVGITVTGVTQDEPVNGIGDGNTSPDAMLHAGSVDVRAERSGVGNGRVYQIAFIADDGAEGMCSGDVTVCVPHSKKDSCVDDGQVFNGLQP